MNNYEKIKKNVFIGTFIVVLIIFGSSRFIVNILSDIEQSFDFYKTNASNGQISLLTINKDLNYISRCTRDIMLDGDYQSNIYKIKEREKTIVKEFDFLEETLKGTSHEKEKLEVFKNAKKYTLEFVRESIKKMESLKNSSSEEKIKSYNVYKKQLTPLANSSREYFQKLSDIKNHGFKVLTEQFYYDIKKQKNIIAIITIFVIFVLVSIMIISLKSLKIYVDSKEKLQDTNTLFQQYKEAMDLTNIVSKTDVKGYITYVNDKFCEVSQYSKEELLGKPHNIVRSPESSKDTFKEMWKDLKSKKVWQGIVQNQKKDGTRYYVYTTIMPILDSNEKIKEYIAIRKDITDIVELNKKLLMSQEEILSRMGMIAETRSKETGYHVRRVSEYCKVLATALGLEEKDIELIYSASALHDIGKVGTPDEVLHKPGRLTFEEFEVMKQHSSNGYDMLKDSKNEIVKTGAIIALEHHEKYDGTGYPRGLSGKDIHIFARITALADVFDALGESRAYKKAWELNDILKLIDEQKGKHFDPEVVDAFFENIEKILFIRKKFKNIE